MQSGFPTVCSTGLNLNLTYRVTFFLVTDSRCITRVNQRYSLATCQHLDFTAQRRGSLFLNFLNNANNCQNIALSMVNHVDADPC